MSLTRKMLKGMSLTDEQIDTVIEAHTDVVNTLKDERDKFVDEREKLKADIEKLKAENSELKKANESVSATTEKLAEVQKELETAKEAATQSEQKYEELQKEFDGYKSEQSAIAEKSAKETAYKEMLKEAGVSEKRIASVMRVTNLDDIKLDKDGKLKNHDELVETAKSEWADFIDRKHVEGADVKNPPANSGTKMTKDEILKIKDTTERQQKIAENHELFGF